jgi:aminopeptidase N
MTDTPQEKFLKDYKKSDFLIPKTNLHFDIRDDITRVEGTFKVIRNTEDKDAPLVLDGEDVELAAIHLDGKLLTASEYEDTGKTLTIPKVSDEFELTILVRIYPDKNKALEGLYRSGDILCTQMEPEGFRRVIYYIDRPDNLSVFTTKIVADKEKYPILLSNGNKISEGEIDEEERHYVVYEDPFLKAGHLFALVAGNLGMIEDTHKTTSGRDVKLQIFCDPGNEYKCRYSMDSLIHSMRWDEDTFGLECDLDEYKIVIVDSFNMGAMENKGLNIFNSSCALADPESSTDDNFMRVEGVIGHEYFHNWTGNRVSVRDWFQLTLKEGLTVFRDQEFSADMNSRSVKRIDDVEAIRGHQFIEDSGPNSHSIRPLAVICQNNFYTSTVYDKGAEVIRMYETIIGKDSFRKGMDKYIEENDGKAVTCEDFFSAMKQTPGGAYLDNNFMLWYSQNGTPTVKVKTNWNEGDKTLTIQLDQQILEGQEPFTIPFSIGILDNDGSDMYTQVIMSQSMSMTSAVILDRKPTAISLNRNFSAPVRVEYDYTDEELRFLLANDSDEFNRYDAGQQLMEREILRVARLYENSSEDETNIEGDCYPNELFDALRTVLNDESIDNEFKTRCLIAPSRTAMLEAYEDGYPIDSIYKARKKFTHNLAEKLEADWLRTYLTLTSELSGKEYQPIPKDIGRRSLRNLCLGMLDKLDDHKSLKYDQYESATNMTEKYCAVGLACNEVSIHATNVLNSFYDTWKDDTLTLNKWFTAQVYSEREDSEVLIITKGLLEHEKFDLGNPNRVRAVIGAFSGTMAFHAKDGSGYEFIADKIIELDGFNPHIAARMGSAFRKYSDLDEVRKPIVKTQLERILAKDGISPDTFEIISKTLKSGE